MNKNFIVLQNKDIWMEVMQFNFVTGEMQTLKRTPDIKVCGHYARVNGESVMFYRRDESLYINVRNDEICLDFNVSMSYERKGDDIEFKLYKGNENVYSVSYPTFRNDPINREDFDFNSDKEEDQDFFLFMYNVANAPERQHIIYI